LTLVEALIMRKEAQISQIKHRSLKQNITNLTDKMPQITQAKCRKSHK
jgi:hypothetical protein